MSIGSRDLFSLERNEVMRGQIDLNLFAFPLEVITTLTKALEDPNRLNDVDVLSVR